MVVCSLGPVCEQVIIQRERDREREIEKVTTVVVVVVVVGRWCFKEVGSCVACCAGRGASGNRRERCSSAGHALLYSMLPKLSYYSTTYLGHIFKCPADGQSIL